ncbi:hypothetical protein BpHYR1_019259 [Brachionus plicatilis]|uniref:Uncharacterized protein n=1 Tax=Brachionus plicatilis TaxID=10195 RepID=A0A3M7PE54_BRAPC|nr:hypothetical protein BpHYR1_019259 [Brachionus plicatilis]
MGRRSSPFPVPFEQRLRPDTEVTASSWSSTPENGRQYEKIKNYFVVDVIKKIGLKSEFNFKISINV